MDKEKLTAFFKDRFGYNAFTDTSLSQWAGQYALPDELLEFYKIFKFPKRGMAFPGVGNSYNVYSLDSLFSRQDGYAYSGKPQQPITGWHPNWIVIADEGADPFIYDTNKKCVLSDMHGQGKWEPSYFCDTPYEMLWAFSVFSFILLNANNNFLEWDEDFDPNAIYYYKALEHLTNGIGDNEKSKALLYNIGMESPSSKSEKYTNLVEVIKLLEHDDEAVRLDFVHALSMFPEKEAHKALLKAKKDKDEDVADAAAYVLEKKYIKEFSEYNW